MQLFFRKFQLIHLNTLVATDINVQIRSFFWSVFSRIRTEYGEIRSMCFEGLEGVISQESHAY